MPVLDKISKEGIDGQLKKLVKIRNTPQQARTKIIKAGTGAVAAVAVAANFIDISAPERGDSDPIGLRVNNKGTVFRGRVGFANTPGDIRVSGLWVLNDLLLSAAPSTMMTPIPVTRFSPPLESVLEYAKTIAVLTSLAGIG